MLTDKEFKEFRDGLLRAMTTPENIGSELGLDLVAQLLAIKNLIRHCKKAEEEWLLEVEKLQKEAQQATYEPGSWEEANQDGAWINHLCDGRYQCAAHSMAATAMLAPFVEMLFVRIFQCIQETGSSSQSDSNHDERCRDNGKYWNPSYYFPPKKAKPSRDLAQGIPQLAVSTGLVKFLPDEYHETVKALFWYRNQMFHNGFEWPKDKCKFLSSEEASKWPETWFTMVDYYSDSPMVIMNDKLIEDCLDTIDGVVAGFCKFRLAKYKV